ncbi:hypothetical protein [Clostridium butyricum]|uniref:hypothetical protein n=1 Tax=Clostridium butyricum TaxID=1492 RepID=UPI0021065F2C|nr:hypothetical protein [Clostridium butyricum]MCQ2013823.1 hypothetical protein [Clostridium butyricum]MCQ2024797.1 hypothetical protein [Clostridium butyricum]
MNICENIEIKITDKNYNVILNIVKELKKSNALDDDNSREIQILLGKLERGDKVLCKRAVNELLFNSIRKYYNKNKNSHNEKVQSIIKYFELNNASPLYWNRKCEELVAEISYEIDTKEKLIMSLENLDVLAGTITSYELITSSFPEKDFDDVFIEI